MYFSLYIYTIYGLHESMQFKKYNLKIQFKTYYILNPIRTVYWRTVLSKHETGVFILQVMTWPDYKTTIAGFMQKVNEPTRNDTLIDRVITNVYSTRVGWM